MNKMMTLRRTKATTGLAAVLLIFLSMAMTMTTVQAFLTTTHDNFARTSVLYADAQPEYGNSLERPSSYVTCGQCGSSYALKKEDLGDGGKGRYVSVRFVF
jgi:hypothetical protein